jgi:hypothetical protein
VWTWIVMLGIMPNLFGVTTRVLHAVPPSAPIAAFAYHEDSLLFLTRARVQRLPDDQLLTWMAASPAGTAIVEDRLLRYVPQDWQPAPGTAPEEGFNPGAGRYQRVWILHRAALPATNP